MCALEAADGLGRCPCCEVAWEAEYAEPAPIRSATGRVLDHYAAVLPASEALLARIALPPTPLVDLGALAPDGVKAYAKIEGHNPTASTKDPMAAVALAALAERGFEEFVFTSTGNSAESFAWALSRFPELRAVLMVPTGFPAPRSAPANLDVRRCAGDYAGAHAYGRAEALRLGIHCEEGFFSIGRREGLKIAYLDAMLAMPTPPTVIVQAISSGMGLLAAARAVRHLRATVGLAPRIVGVQQDSCAPIVSAMNDDAPAIREQDKVEAPDGVSVATLLGDPTPSYPDVRRAILNSGGSAVGIDREEALVAHARLTDAGLAPCMASALSYAALGVLLRRGELTEEDVVLVMLTGGDSCSAGRAEAGRKPRRTPPRAWPADRRAGRLPGAVVRHAPEP